MQVQYYGIKIIYARKVSKILKKRWFFFPVKTKFDTRSLKNLQIFRLSAFCRGLKWRELTLWNYFIEFPFWKTFGTITKFDNLQKNLCFIEKCPRGAGGLPLGLSMIVFCDSRFREWLMVNYYVGVIRHQKMMEVGASGQGFPPTLWHRGDCFPTSDKRFSDYSSYLILLARS